MTLSQQALLAMMLARYFAVFGQAMPSLRAAWTNSDIHLERRIRRNTAKRKQATIPRQEEGESLAPCEIQVEEPVVVANLADPTAVSNHDLLQASFPKVPNVPSLLRYRKRIRDFVFPTER